MKTDYKALDSAILAAITSAGRISFNAINGRCVAEAREAMSDRKAQAFRAVDRRLQALRKAGKIEHDGSCWKIAKN